jgi:hypothetical protein
MKKQKTQIPMRSVHEIKSAVNAFLKIFKLFSNYFSDISQNIPILEFFIVVKSTQNTQKIQFNLCVLRAFVRNLSYYLF